MPVCPLARPLCCGDEGASLAPVTEDHTCYWQAGQLQQQQQQGQTLHLSAHAHQRREYCACPVAGDCCELVTAVGHAAVPLFFCRVSWCGLCRTPATGCRPLQHTYKIRWKGLLHPPSCQLLCHTHQQPPLLLLPAASHRHCSRLSCQQHCTAATAQHRGQIWPKLACCAGLLSQCASALCTKVTRCLQCSPLEVARFLEIRDA